MKNIIKYSEKMMDLSVNCEKVFSLAGDLNSNEELITLVEMFEKEVEKELGFKYQDFENFCDNIIEKKKYGLLAEISQLQFEKISETSRLSTGVRTIKLIYAESYEELLKKTIEFSENYFKKLDKKTKSKKEFKNKS